MLGDLAPGPANGPQVAHFFPTLCRFNEEKFVVHGETISEEIGLDKRFLFVGAF